MSFRLVCTLRRVITILQIPDDRPSTEACQVGGSIEIPPGELMAPWVYDEKFLTGMRFQFGTLSLTVGEDDDLEHLIQE
jgi:hypothetical protein